MKYFPGGTLAKAPQTYDAVVNKFDPKGFHDTQVMYLKTII